LFHGLHCYSFTDISDVLGLGRWSVARAHRRALRKLRTALGVSRKSIISCSPVVCGAPSSQQGALPPCPLRTVLV
jgi:hypothetical protein